MPEPSLPKPNNLLDQLCEAIRIKHYSYSTEKIYVHHVLKRRPKAVRSPLDE